MSAPRSGPTDTRDAGESAESFRDAIRAGDRRALARAITLIESRRPEQQALGQAVLDLLVAHTGRAIRVGITGPPGAGKSTFIEALGQHVLGRGSKLAVLAVDPSSPVTGGSILPFFERPVSAVLAFLTILALAWPILVWAWRLTRSRAARAQA